jgi:hypothetical protein
MLRPFPFFVLNITAPVGAAQTQNYASASPRVLRSLRSQRKTLGKKL